MDKEHSNKNYQLKQDLVLLMVQIKKMFQRGTKNNKYIYIQLS